MKKEIHPELKETKVVCRGCDNKFSVMGQLKQDVFYIEVCSNCHSAYTGKRKVLSAGAIDKFKQKYNNFLSN
ncbi:MAG: 50S ribosomal protein L31 [Legionellales bacterium]|nr:50S ribosomal protein L31 [Legionellales bacterium]OUX64789.1 MAG: 50S ribosomal protein L31 [Gammaproteobacteria bacterium TMED281]|tara:strand:- start:744 stop:959 length:216 start_codon:yes stop_codon:yes gene_type:complete